MRSLVLISVLLVACSFSATANMACGWISAKQGITINYVSECDRKNQQLIDSVLNNVIHSLSRKNTSLKVLVLVNHYRLSFPGKPIYFFSIGYDTLRQVDDDYIFDYYNAKVETSERRNGGFNRFESKRSPLDMNATAKATVNEVGIKIIYDADSFKNPDWNILTKAVIYAVKNVALIKTSQRRDTVRYNTNGWYLSLLTLDTIKINEILGKARPKKIVAVPFQNKYYYVLFALVLVIVLVVFVAVRKK